MTDKQFINTAFCFEKSDKVMHKKKWKVQKNKDKRKNDSTESMLRNDQSCKDKAKKHCADDKKSKNGKGVALYCALCVSPGALHLYHNCFSP